MKVHVRGLSQLQVLHLEATNVSYAGVPKVEKALLKLKVYR